MDAEGRVGVAVWGYACGFRGPCRHLGSIPRAGRASPMRHPTGPRRSSRAGRCRGSPGPCCTAPRRGYGMRDAPDPPPGRPRRARALGASEVLAEPSHGTTSAQRANLLTEREMVGQERLERSASRSRNRALCQPELQPVGVARGAGLEPNVDGATIRRATCCTIPWCVSPGRSRDEKLRDRRAADEWFVDHVSL